MTQWIIVDDTQDLTGIGARYEDQDDFELRVPPASSSQMLEVSHHGQIILNFLERLF